MPVRLCLLPLLSSVSRHTRTGQSTWKHVLLEIFAPSMTMLQESNLTLPPDGTRVICARPEARDRALRVKLQYGFCSWIMHLLMARTSAACTHAQSASKDAAGHLVAMMRLFIQEKGGFLAAFV